MVSANNLENFHFSSEFFADLPDFHKNFANSSLEGSFVVEMSSSTRFSRSHSCSTTGSLIQVSAAWMALAFSFGNILFAASVGSFVDRSSLANILFWDSNRL